MIFHLLNSTPFPPSFQPFTHNPSRFFRALRARRLTGRPSRGTLQMGRAVPGGLCPHPHPKYLDGFCGSVLDVRGSANSNLSISKLSLYKPPLCKGDRSRACPVGTNSEAEHRESQGALARLCEFPGRCPEGTEGLIYRK